MKKTIIGSIVGGLLIFIWQTLSWTMLQLHQPAQQYHPKQDTVMAFLNATMDKEGGYIMPTVPPGASWEEAEKNGEKAKGKPWAQIQYHKSFNVDSKAMMVNMVRGFLSDIIMVWLLIWIFGKMNRQSFFTIFLASIFVGIIAFTNFPYTNHIWYEQFDIKAQLIDALLSWGLCGLWLGWWLNRK